MKVDNGNTRLLCEICSKLNDVTESRTMLAERRHVRSRSGILIGSFENILCIIIVFLITLNK